MTQIINGRPPLDQSMLPLDPTQDHYYALDGDANDSGTGTAIDGTATAGVSFDGAKASLPSGEEINLGTAADIALDETKPWRCRCVFTVPAGGSGVATLWIRFDASNVWSADNKQFCVTAAGSFDIYINGGFTLSVGSGLNDGAEHSVEVIKAAALIAILIDEDLVYVGTPVWPADTGTLRLGVAVADDPKSIHDFWYNS